MITQDRVVEHITKWHLEHHGGYPFGSRWHNGELIVAEAYDGGGSSVEIYTQSELDQWVIDANQYIADVLAEDGEVCDQTDAILETRPTRETE